jgi:glycine/D-amino acid oxidase-like deaminating enzyme
VTKTLLERHPTATVTVLEARALCSGATGRNGGQMAANAGEQYSTLADTHGVETAGKIVDFTFRNLEKMQDLIKEYDAVELSEMQSLRKLRVFLSQGKFDDFKKSIARLEADHPSRKGLYTILDANAVVKVSLLYQVCAILDEGCGVLMISLGTWNPWHIRRSTSSCWHSMAISSCHQNLRNALGEIPRAVEN